MKKKNNFGGMGRKGLIGLCTIWFVAFIAIAAVSIYGSTMKLNYIEQIHLQDGYLYYVDRGKGDDLKIIRSDLDGGNGDMIICKRHDREQYRMVRQIFFDSEGEVYALVAQTDVESWNDVSCKVYRGTTGVRQGKVKISVS